MKSSDNLDQERVDELLGALAKLASRGIGSVAKTGAKASSKLGQLGAAADAKRDAKKKRKQNLKDREAVAKDAKKKLASGDFSDSDALDAKAKKKKLARERLAAKGITLKSDKKNPNRPKKGELGDAKRTFDTETMTTTSTPARTAREKFDVAMRKRRAKKRLTMGTEVDGDQISEAKKKVEDENKSNFDLGSEPISATTDRTPDPSKKTYSDDDYIPNPTLTPEDEARFAELRKKADAKFKAEEDKSEEQKKRRASAQAELDRLKRPDRLKRFGRQAANADQLRAMGMNPGNLDVENRAERRTAGVARQYGRNFDAYFGRKERQDALERAEKFQSERERQAKIMDVDNRGRGSEVPSEILSNPPSSPNADFAVDTGQTYARRSDPEGRGREGRVSRRAVHRGLKAVNQAAKEYEGSLPAGPLPPDGPTNPDPVINRRTGEEIPDFPLGDRAARIRRQRGARRAAIGRMGNSAAARADRAKAVAQIRQRNLDRVLNRPEGQLAPMRGQGNIGPIGDEPLTQQQINTATKKRDRMFDFRKALAGSGGNIVRHKIANRRAMQKNRGLR